MAQNRVDVARRPRHDAWVGVPTVGTVLGARLAPGLVNWQLRRSGIDSQLAGSIMDRVA